VQRVLEPELMLDPAQAQAYASADFEEPHSRFVTLLLARFPEIPPQGVALDLGCGPGDIVLRFLRACHDWYVDAIDGSPAMLALARQAAAAAGLASRVCFIEAVLPRAVLPSASYDLIFSNSLLHHLHHPEMFWETVVPWSRDGTRLFVMDLMRPHSDEDAAALVERYAAAEPAVLKRDFYNSLRAAFSLDEIRAQLEHASLPHLAVEPVSDRHLIIWGTIRLG
jgi:SAM-dependent methyltransferase